MLQIPQQEVSEAEIEVAVATLRKGDASNDTVRRILEDLLPTLNRIAKENNDGRLAEQIKRIEGEMEKERGDFLGFRLEIAGVLEHNLFVHKAGLN